MTATTTAHSGQRTTPAAVIGKRRQDGARSPASTLACLEAPAGRGRAQRLQEDSGAPRRRKPAPSVKVPAIAECLTAGGETCRIPIAGGGFAIIDAEDFGLVAVACWHMGGTESRYPVSRSKCFGGRTTYLHRVVMRAEPGELIDHWNGDRLNARKGNLRKATRGQNTANKGFTKSASGYYGVHVYSHNKRKPYRASLQHGGAVWRGKYRATAIEAAKDYDAKAREVWGAFASLNFPAPGERRCKPVGAALEARQRQAPQRRKVAAHV